MQLFHSNHIHFDFIVDAVRATAPVKIFDEIENNVTGLKNKNLSRYLKKAFEEETQERAFAIGEGVAILTAKSYGMDRKVIGFLRLAKPLEFDAPDEKPCDLVAVVVSPKHHGPLHLRRLSRVTRLLKDKDLIQKLRGAENEDVLKILLGSNNNIANNDQFDPDFASVPLLRGRV